MHGSRQLDCDFDWAVVWDSGKFELGHGDRFQIL
jgi:hypothetical protein